jgi:hypothetical protein
MSAIAIPQLEGSTFTTAYPQLFKEMSLHDSISALPQIFSAFCNFKKEMLLCN